MAYLNAINPALSSLAVNSGTVIQTVDSGANGIDGLTTGLSILLIGFLGILTYATIKLNSPVALLGEAATVTFFVLSVVGIIEPRLFYLVGAMHGLTIAASGVFYND